MLNKRTLTIIKRELNAKLLSKTFIVMTLLIPLFLFGILSLQTYLINATSDEGAKLIIYSETDDIQSSVMQQLLNSEYVKNGKYVITFKMADGSNFGKYLEENKPDLLNDKLTGVLFIPKNAVFDKTIKYYSKNPNNTALFKNLRSDIDKALVELYFKGKNISKEDISFAGKKVNISSFKVSKTEKAVEEGYGNLAVAFLFTFLIYFSLLFTGQMTMNSVVEEKNNKIVELLLSSASSKELLTGKILGVSITGFLQMGIWLSPLILVLSTSWFMLPEKFVLSISIMHVLYYLINYLIALITFMGLYATLGSIFDNTQDAQSGVWPLTLLIMVPFFIAITLENNPENQIAKITSMLPFASLIVMPARASLIDIPVWQFIISIVVNIATMVLIWPLAGKVYRVGILMTGKKPKWTEVIKWLKYKY